MVETAGPKDGVPQEILSWKQFGIASRALADQVLASGYQPDIVVAIARGGLIPAGALAYALGTKATAVMNVEFYLEDNSRREAPEVLPPFLDAEALATRRALVVDDVADSGRTLRVVLDIMVEAGVETRSAVLYHKPWSTVTPDYEWRTTEGWITFPWT